MMRFWSGKKTERIENELVRRRSYKPRICPQVHARKLTLTPFAFSWVDMLALIFVIIINCYQDSKCHNFKYQYYHFSHFAMVEFFFVLKISEQSTQTNIWFAKHQMRGGGGGGGGGGKGGGE